MLRGLLVTVTGLAVGAAAAVFAEARADFVRGERTTVPQPPEEREGERDG